MEKIGVNWNEKTTKLGALVIAGMTLSLVFSYFGNQEMADTVKNVFGWGIGVLGLAVKD